MRKEENPMGAHNQNVPSLSNLQLSESKLINNKSSNIEMYSVAGSIKSDIITEETSHMSNLYFNPSELRKS